MKRILILLVMTFWVAGCATPGPYNTQKGALIGAGLGAIAGQAIGHNTEATLIGTGVGTLLGAVIGNLEDQRMQEARWAHQEYRIQQEQNAISMAPEPQQRTEPPGRWVTVPGHWEGNHWVPEHQEWRPVHPLY
jgi:outer membrane lipoprotein SlyB